MPRRAGTGVVADVILVKDQDGRTYIPSLSIDGIGTMKPGQGYQIKMLHARTLNFPARPVRGMAGSKQVASATNKAAAAPPWKSVNTGTSHTVIVPLSANPSLDGVPLTDGDCIGVFYDSSGTMACAGYEMWTGSGNIAIPAFGDDPSSADKDGFAGGESFRWRVWRHDDGVVADAAASYLRVGGLGGIVTDTSAYVANGISALTSLSGMIAGVDQAGLPVEFSLSQNYPNPFNPVTKIRLTVAERRLTIVSVYDVLGREVATLMNEVKDPGTFEVVFDASGLASGVYLYKMQVRGSDFPLRDSAPTWDSKGGAASPQDSRGGAGGFVAVKRLLLIRDGPGALKE